MSARDETHKSQRYQLGELLRDAADHLLLLTATPHKGDPENFTLFLQLLDRDAYADVSSIREAMDRRRAPFYLRRTKEAMVYFPERGPEHAMYLEVTRFVKRQSRLAAARGDDPRARAVGFLMSLYQRRLASSARAMRRSLDNRARRLEDGLTRAQALAQTAPADLPAPDELEEMEEAERERLEAVLEAVTVAGGADEVLHRADLEIGKANEEKEKGTAGADGRLARAEARHDEVSARRERRRDELVRQRAVTLQGVERLASALMLPHPERGAPEVRRLRPHPETEMTAMRVVMEHERTRGRQVEDVHQKNLGYDVTSLDPVSGELRLIEVKGLAAGGGGDVLLTPNERRVAEDRPDCYWLYVVTGCADAPRLQEPIRDPARLTWREVTQVAHYRLRVDALKQPMEVREKRPGYGGGEAG